MSFSSLNVGTINNSEFLFAFGEQLVQILGKQRLRHSFVHVFHPFKVPTCANIRTRIFLKTNAAQEFNDDFYGVG